MSDLTPADAIDVSAPAPADKGAPFVRVLVDRTAGQAIVALDAAAVDALLHFINDVGPGYDLTMNPGHYGLDDDTAHALADVLGRITGPLSAIVRDL